MHKNLQCLCMAVMLLAVLAISSPACALGSLYLDKSIFSPGEPISVHCTGLTEQEGANQCWIAIAKPGDPASTYQEWSYLPAGNSLITLRSPSATGTYEIRFYSGNAASETNLVHSRTLPFSVSYGKTIERLATDRSSYRPGQYMQISYSGITQEAAQREAWVAVARTTDPAGSYMNWKYVSAGSGILWLEVPGESGSYEVRYYPSGQANETVLADGLRIPFSVEDTPLRDNAVLYPTRNDFDWNLLDFVPGRRPWTGSYTTNYHTLTLIQTDNTVTGTYPEWNDGHVEGVAENGVLYGYWSQSPTYAPPDNAGQIIFVQHPDGQGFHGWWRYGNSGTWQSWSSGTLNSQQSAAVWNHEDIYQADAHSLIPRCLQGTDLTQPITAAECTALALRVFEELWQTQEIPVSAPFSDISGHALQGEIEKAYGLGFLNAFTPGLFRPDAGLTREQAAVILANLVKACEFDDCTRQTIDDFFLPYTVKRHLKDDALIPSVSRDAIYFLTTNGLMDTLNGYQFMPGEKATREQAIVTARRIYDREVSIMKGLLAPAGTP